MNQKDKWLTVPAYAKKHGKTTQWIYTLIQMNRLKYRKSAVLKEFIVYEVLDEITLNGLAAATEKKKR